MAISNSHPVRFTSIGLVDAYDATGRFPGAARRLQNLVFDGSNPELVLSRPGVTLLADFSTNGFTTPGFVSVQASVGTRIFGMIASARNAGNDEPFCFDTATGLFVTISGVTGANTPTSPATFGDWTPPTMAVVGVMVLVTHPGFSGAVGKFFGIIDISNPAAPAWSVANTVTTLLPNVPLAVANFNNRAYFACRNALYYTDVLTNPPTITNATQFLTLGDSSNITALVGLPMQTTSSGVLQSLTVYKPTQIWQVTGDAAFNNLAENYISLNVGTLAPRSVVQSPFGQYFYSTGGPYFVDLLGALRPLTHSLQDLEPDIQQPFINARFPSRWAGAYNSTIYRVCGPTVVNSAATTNDYWFDEHKRRWNGPHNFTYDCASAVGGFFVLSAAGNPGILIKSQPTQTQNLTLTDLGSNIATSLLTSTFPKIGDMAIKQVAESQIELGATAAVHYTITALDEGGSVLDQTVIGVTPVGAPWGYFYWGMGTLWTASNTWGGGSVWGGGGVWGAGVPAIPRTYPVTWNSPFVFEKMALQVDAIAFGQATIGTFYARYQQTGYMTVRR
jgi:hypothetical protein